MLYIQMIKLVRLNTTFVGLFHRMLKWSILCWLVVKAALAITDDEPEAVDLDATYRRLNHPENYMNTKAPPNMCPAINLELGDVGLTIRNKDNCDVQINTVQVIRELDECLKLSEGKMSDFQMRCAVLCDDKGSELQIAYGTNRSEVHNSGLCWSKPEHIGVLVCSVQSFNSLFEASV